MSYASLDELRSQLGGTPVITEAYRAKMLHPLPVMPTVDRDAFLVKRATGKRVLDFGASGALSVALQAAASEYFGVDRAPDPARRIHGFDLDDVETWTLPRPREGVGGYSPASPITWTNLPLDLIVCGEVLEHLGNPLQFLTRLALQFHDVPVVITVPNAFNAAAPGHLAKGLENVNKDHVAWYSPTTLATLLARSGLTILDWACYGGTAPTAEGLIVIAGAS